MASVALVVVVFTLDKPKELKFQLWLRLSVNCSKNIKGPGVASVVVVFTLDKPKELKFQLWLRLSVNC